MHDLPWTHTEKRQRLGQVQTQPTSMGLQENRCSPFMQLPTKKDAPLDDEDESNMRVRTYWGKICESRTQDERHHDNETILECVQKAERI